MPMSLGTENNRQEYTREDLIKPFLNYFDQSSSSIKTLLSVSDTLDALFPEQKRQEKDISKAKEALGDLSKLFTELEIREIVTDIDLLVSNWLDELERILFEGQTLLELLHEKGGQL